MGSGSKLIFFGDPAADADQPMSINVGALRLAQPDHDLVLTGDNIAVLARFLDSIKHRTVGQLQSDQGPTGTPVLQLMRGGRTAFTRLGRQLIHALDDETAGVAAGQFWVLRIGNVERLYGALTGDVFVALWWDPQHNLMP